MSILLQICLLNSLKSNFWKLTGFEWYVFETLLYRNVTKACRDKSLIMLRIMRNTFWKSCLSLLSDCLTTKR